MGEGALGGGVEVVFVQAGAAVALAAIDDAGGVGGPVGVGLGGVGAGDALGLATVFGGGGKDVAVGYDGDLFTIRGEGKAGPLGEGGVGGAGGAGCASEGDLDRLGFAGGGVHGPDAEVALEEDGLAVVADGGPEDAAVGEVSELRRFAGRDVGAVEVLSAGMVGHEVEVFAVRRPHGPRVFAGGGEELAVGAGGGEGFEPDLGLVDVGVTVAPPLRGADAFGDEGDLGAVGGGGGLEFVEVAVAGDFEGGATGRADSVDVSQAGDVGGGRGEVEPLTVAGPGVEVVGCVGVGDALGLAGGEGEDVGVAEAGAGGDEGEASAVGGVEGARLGGGVGDEQVGFAT